MAKPGTQTSTFAMVPNDLGASTLRDASRNYTVACRVAAPTDGPACDVPNNGSTPASRGLHRGALWLVSASWLNASRRVHGERLLFEQLPNSSLHVGQEFGWVCLAHTIYAASCWLVLRQHAT
jgi:hypothetical protein